MPLEEAVHLSLPETKPDENQCYFTVGVHAVGSRTRTSFRSLWNNNRGAVGHGSLSRHGGPSQILRAIEDDKDNDDAFRSETVSPAGHRGPRSSPTALALTKHPIWGAQYHFCKYGIDKPILDPGELLRLHEEKAHQAAKPVSSIYRYGFSQSPLPNDEKSRRNTRAIQRHLRSFFAPSKNRKVTLRSGGSTEEDPELTEEPSNPWVLHPSSPIRQKWDILMVLLILTTILEAPLNVAFFPELFEPRELLVFNMIGDLFSAIDIILNFWTGYHEKGGVLRQVQMQPNRIRDTYLRGWFGVDLASTIPYDVLTVLVLRGTTNVGMTKDDAAVRVVKFLALPRVLRVFRLYRYLPRCQKTFYSAQQWMYIRIVNLGLCMVIVAHWNGCIHFLVNYCLGFPAKCWVALNGIKHAPWWEQWSWSFFNAISQTFGISFGRGTPETLVDMWFTLWGMVTGTSGYALILANIATMWQHVDASRKLHRQKMQEVEDYMGFRRFPRALRLKVRDYFEQRYRGHIFNEDDILATLSDPLKEVVMRHNCEETLRVVPFFAKADPAFVNELFTHLRFHLFQPGDVIVSYGTVGSNMFFIQSGRVTVANEDDRVLATLEAGMYFGELSLIVTAKRNATVRAKTHCSLLELSRENFEQVLKKFPAIENGIKAVAGEILLNTRTRSGSFAEHNQDTVTSLGTFIGFKESASP